MKTSGSGAIHKPKQAISNIRGTPAAYDTVSVFENGGYQTYVVTHCIECGEETRVHWNTGGADPRFVDKKMRGLGWHYDAFKPKACVCPTCVTGKKTFQRVDPSTVEVTDSPDGIEIVFTLPSEETMAKTANSFVPTTMPSTSTAVLAAAQAQSDADDTVGRTTLTANEKARMRRLLDIHFDDQLGRYIDNYDDERVAKETNIPRKYVTEYRELAYGPLKADPAVEAVKAEVAALRKELSNLNDIVEDARAQFVRLNGRVVNVEAKAKKLP